MNISACRKAIKMFKLVGGSPLSQGLPPLEKRPPDVFQFTPCPSSSKAIRARGAGKEFRACGRDQRAPRPLDTSPARGGAGPALFGRHRRPH